MIMFFAEKLGGIPQASIYIGLANFLATIFIAFLCVDSITHSSYYHLGVGRRPLLISGGMLLTAALFATAALTNQKLAFFGFLLAYAVAFGMSYGPVVYISLVTVTSVDGYT